MKNMNIIYFFASTNYLACTIPAFYQENPKAKELTLKRLDEHISKKGFWNWAERSFAKSSKINLQKIKQKGE